MASSRLGEEIERLYSRVNEQEREIRKKQGVLVSVLDDARVAEKEKDQVCASLDSAAEKFQELKELSLKNLEELNDTKNTLDEQRRLMSKLEIDTDTLKQKRAKEIEEKMEERHFIIDTYRKKLTETEQFVDYMESLKRNHLHSIEVGENEDFALMIKSMSKTEFTGAHLESQLTFQKDAIVKILNRFVNNDAQENLYHASEVSFCKVDTDESNTKRYIHIKSKIEEVFDLLQEMNVKQLCKPCLEKCH